MVYLTITGLIDFKCILSDKNGCLCFQPPIVPISIAIYYTYRVFPMLSVPHEGRHRKGFKSYVV